jgi:diguanylate cyclase (GGDEF)-like protein/PAS domain S-box-containing protein
MTDGMTDDLEAQRLQALDDYEIFDTGPEPVFDGYAERLADVLHVPMVAISFVGLERVAFKTQFGYIARALARGESFCQYAIACRDILIVPDTAADPRFQNSPLVTGPDGIRFYAGAPLITPHGFCIGILCVMDRRPRDDFGKSETQTLREVALVVMRELEGRRKLNDLQFFQEMNTEIAQAKDFQSSMEAALRRAGQRIGAAYCMVPEQGEQPGPLNFVATVAIMPEFEAAVADIRRAPQADVAPIHALQALVENRIIDTGVVTADMLGSFSKVGRRFFALGIRRQIAVPLNLGSRRAAVLFGFTRHHISEVVRGFLSDLVTKLVPLLLGRLREEELERSRTHLRYVNRAMRALIGANQALASAETEMELVRSICRVAVTHGGYAAAWVGFAEHDAQRSIRVAARWGDHFIPLERMPMTWADTPFGRGASGTAIRENRPVVIDNIALDARVDPFRAYSTMREFRSCIAVPLRDAKGEAIGVFSIYNSIHEEPLAPDLPSFDIEEAELLAELARDIVNGINMIRDRDARDAALKRQQASDARLANLLASSPAIMFALEHDGQRWRPMEITQNFERILGYSIAEAMVPGWWPAHIHPQDYPATQEALRRAAAGERQLFQYRLADRAGGYRWIRSEMEYQPAQGAEPARIIGAWFDISEKQAAQNEIHRLAFYDQLTGLANRQMLKQQIENAARRTASGSDYAALLFIDLDGFKAINDAHGHAIGDQVLIAVARRLRRALRERDTVARLGGDEFVVLLPRLGNSSAQAAEQAGILARRIAAALERQITADDLVLHVTASIGIHSFNAKTMDMEQILRSADTAMYAAKAITKRRGWSLGHSNISLFEPVMQDRVTQYHAVQNELREALAQERFELWLQPQMDIAETITGAEALIRLHRPDGSLMQPDAFVQIAEESGLIVPIGQWVRAQACRLLARYSSAELPRLSVNISAIEFGQPRIVEQIIALLEKTHTDPRRLTLEITESLLIDGLDETIVKLDTLAAHGIGLSIDDFGTGYSSLAYLQRLPITEIKIDKRFVHGMLTDRRSADLTQSLIMLAKNFGFDVIAEGVETRAQAEFLNRLGCRVMQGFLFGRPRAAWDFTAPIVMAGAGRPAATYRAP